MKQRGFTLLEVMIAMAIFAVSAMAILSSTGQTINTLGALEKKSIAAMVADNQLALLSLAGLPTSEQSGSEQMGDENWYWTAKPLTLTGSQLRGIDLIVWRDEKRDSPLVSVRTYVAAE